MLQAAPTIKTISATTRPWPELKDSMQHLRVARARGERRLREVLARGEIGIGIRLEHVERAVAPQAEIHARIAGQVQRARKMRLDSCSSRVMVSAGRFSAAAVVMPYFC